MTDLPDGWSWATLYDVAAWGSGGTPSRSTTSFYGGGIPWAVIGDLNDSTVVSTAESISDEAIASSSAKLVQPGTLLLAMYGSIGKLGIAGVPMATNQAIAFAVPDDRLMDGRYLFHYLRSQRGALNRAGKGATQKNISQSILRTWPLPVPPRSEQERIVAVLEEHLSRVDAAETAARSARERLGQFSGAVLESIFDREWDRRSLESLNVAERPICYGILKPKTPGVAEVPYVEVRSIVGRRIEVEKLHRTTRAMHEAFIRSELRANDVVLAIRGSFDRAAVVPESLAGANVSRDVARIAPTSDLLPPILAAFLVSPEARQFFRRHVRGVAVQGINIGDLRRLPVPAPTLEDQRDAVSRIEATATAAARIEVEIRTAEARSRHLRRSILAAAFSGRLVPQDPDDEPASELLGRIGTEQAAADLKRRPQRVKAS
jgi:type I restriction enzyme S subunit